MRRFRRMANCWSCSTDLGALRKVGREELCGQCHAWVHSCKNCRFWDESGRTCEEPAAEWVHDRERANFCDFFAMPAPDVKARSASAGPPQPDGRNAFDRLFKR
jgi:hypothetical protein